MAGIVIKGTGNAHGEKSISNDDLAKVVDTNDEWIRIKTGIRSRYKAENKKNIDMAFEASKEAIADSGIDISNIKYVLTATFSPDDLAPSMSCELTGKLGLSENVFAMDSNCGCAGFVYCCRVANALLALEEDKNAAALILGSEKVLSYVDMQDRSTCVLFGDGAGAIVVQYDEDAKFYYYGGCKPDRDVLYVDRESQVVKMVGQEVYKFAVSKVPKAIRETMRLAGITEEGVDYFVCHQANERIIDGAARRFTKNKNKFYKNLFWYGNTSAASIPIALGDMNKERLFDKRQRLICTGFGAGLVYGSIYIEVKKND